MIKLHIFPLYDDIDICTKPLANAPKNASNNKANSTDLISNDPNNQLIIGTDNKLFVPIFHLQNLPIVTITEVKQDFEEINK